MPNTILIKRSNVANAVPASGNLQAGELAINYLDGNLFFKDNSGNVQTIASTKFVNVSGNITGGNIVSNGAFSVAGDSVFSGNVNLGDVANITIDGGTSGYFLQTDGAGNLSWAAGGNGGGGFGNLVAPMPYLVNVGETYTLSANFQGLFAEPITLNGTLEVFGDLIDVGPAGLISVAGNISGGNILTAGLISATGNITGNNLIGLVSTNTRQRTINFNINGGGSVITTGSKGYVVIDANCIIQSWTILLDASGNANVDVKRATYADFPTTASIAGTIPPTVTSNTKAQNTTLSGWGNTTIVSGDILEFVVQGTPAVATNVTVSLSLISTS